MQLRAHPDRLKSGASKRFVHRVDGRGHRRAVLEACPRDVVLRLRENPEENVNLDTELGRSVLSVGSRGLLEEVILRRSTTTREFEQHLSRSGIRRARNVR